MDSNKSQTILFLNTKTLKLWDFIIPVLLGLFLLTVTLTIDYKEKPNQSFKMFFLLFIILFIAMIIKSSKNKTIEKIILDTDKDLLVISVSHQFEKNQIVSLDLKNIKIESKIIRSRLIPKERHLILKDDNNEIRISSRYKGIGVENFDNITKCIESTTYNPQ